MATPFTMNAATQAANAMLKADKAKAQWSKLPLDSLPADGLKLAQEAMIAECMARRAMIAFREYMDDKTSSRYAYAIERGVTDPNMLGDMLFTERRSTSPALKVVSFNELVSR